MYVYYRVLDFKVHGKSLIITAFHPSSWIISLKYSEKLLKTKIIKHYIVYLLEGNTTNIQKIALHITKYVTAYAMFKNNIQGSFEW